MFLQSRTTRTRSLAGVTLIELLIVMTILLMVTAAAIPLMIPALQNRRGREAARLVSSFISAARSRAIETGRPVGVMLERFNGLPFAMSLSYVEVPPAYAGDFQNSKLLVSASGQITGFAQSDTQWMNFLRYGDVVKLDYKGVSYFLSSSATWPDAKFSQVVMTPPSSGNWFLVTSAGAAPATAFPASYSTVGAAFQFIRQPVRSSLQPLQIPDGIVVDLFNSGVAGFNGGVYPTTVVGGVPTVGFNPIFTFTPSGSLDYVDSTGTGLARPLGAIFLLVGRRDQMPDVAGRGRKSTPTSSILINNLTDPDSIWVTVGYQTGLVASAENLPPEAFTDTNGNGAKDMSESFVDRNGNGVWDGPESFTDTNGDGVWESMEPIINDLNSNGVCDNYSISLARFYALQAQSMGGR